jgi:hypothetical protein
MAQIENDTLLNGFYSLQVPWDGEQAVKPLEILYVHGYLIGLSQRNGRLRAEDRNIKNYWRVGERQLDNIADGNANDMQSALALVRSPGFEAVLNDIALLSTHNDFSAYRQHYNSYVQVATGQRERGATHEQCLRELTDSLSVFNVAAERQRMRRTVFMLHALGIALGLYTFFHVQRQASQTQSQGLLNQIRIAGNATGRTGNPKSMLKKVQQQFRPANVEEMLGYLPQALQHALNTRGNILALDVPEDRKFTEIGLVLLGTLAIVLALMRQ